MTNSNPTRADVTILNDRLPGFHGTAKLIEVAGKHYVVSATVAPFSGPETLVFQADANGQVTNWVEVAGGRGSLNHEVAIADLLNTLAAGGEK